MKNPGKHYSNSRSWRKGLLALASSLFLLDGCRSYQQVPLQSAGSQWSFSDTYALSRTDEGQAHGLWVLDYPQARRWQWQRGEKRNRKVNLRRIKRNR